MRPPDAAIVDAFRDYFAAVAEEDRLDRLTPDPTEGSPQGLALEAGIAVCRALRKTALETAASLPAQTAAGLRAMALLVEHALPAAVDSFELVPEDSEFRLAMSLVRDVLLLNGGQA